MRVFRRMVMFAVTLLACAGVYTALRNMPVLSGCGFYAECPEDAARTVAMDAGDPPSP